MATIDYLNTGTKEKEDLQALSQARQLSLSSEKPLGIRLPLSKGRKASEDLFAMNFDVQKQISNNYKIFLTTKKGELLCNPDFGLTIFDTYNSNGISLEDKENIVMEDIKKNTKKYFPSIKLKDFQSDLVPAKTSSDSDYFLITITYTLEILGIEDILHTIELAIKGSI